jgi:hypothetical protein
LVREVRAADEARWRMPFLPIRPVRPDAVQVDRGVLRQRVVDDVRQVGDVDAARGDVGGHEELRTSPTLTFFMTFERRAWESSPDRSCTSRPWRSRKAATVAVSSRVLQKMMAEVGVFDVEQVEQRADACAAFGRRSRTGRGR